MRIDVKRLAFGALFPVILFVSFSNALFLISLTALALLTLASLWQEKDGRIFRDPFAILIGLFLLANALSLVVSDYPVESARGLFKVFRSALFCLSVAYVIDSKEKFVKIFKWLLVVAFLIGVDALLQGQLGRDLLCGRSMIPYSGSIMRLTGPFKHANDFSAYLALACLLFLGVIADARKIFSFRGTLFIATGFFILFASLLWTYSRGAWIAVGLAAFLLMVCRKSRWLVAVTAAAALYVVLFSPPLLKLRVVSLFDRGKGTLHERLDLWGESLRMIGASPWVGLGVNTYARNEPFYKREGSKTDHQYAHNGYLQMAAEIGLVGLFSFLAVVFRFFMDVFLAYRRGPPALKAAALSLGFAVFSFLLHSATDTNLQSLLLVNLLWLAMGLGWACRRLASS